ncbi:MAG: TauD/TfdA family dioxygenase [Litoreibacter sp.]|uniref:TauD/TfdA family dioxygenase n=1 Tax=Litoreibacter sp. TaxID=1969459 RepID=UPI0032971D84
MTKTAFPNIHRASLSSDTCQHLAGRYWADCVANVELRTLLAAASRIAFGDVVILTFPGDNFTQTRSAALRFVNLVGNAVEVERAEKGIWYSLGVDPAAAPIAANGTGPNVPHVDMLTLSKFPDAMGILCERPDPYGGGHTVLAPIELSVSQLSEPHVTALMDPIFSYWPDDGLKNVGHYQSHFSILPTKDDPRFRFTSKMMDRIAKVPLSDAAPPQARGAVEALADALAKNVMKIQLQRGDLVLFSQHHHCHGRTALGAEADKPGTGAPRQLWRMYFNLSVPITSAHSTDTALSTAP